MTRRLSSEDLDRLEALAAGATPGPWEGVTSRCIDGPDYAEVIRPGRVDCMAYCYGGTSTVEGDNLDADSALIVAARNALPALLAEVRAARSRSVEWAVCWGGVGGQPVVTDIGADEEDVRHLVAEQDGYAVAVHRRVSPWEVVE